MNCTACGGDLMVLGILGNMVALRCRQCGSEAMKPVEDVKQDHPELFDDEGSVYLEVG